MKYLILMSALLMAGCEVGEKEKDGSGSMRFEIFKTCMELAAKSQSPQQSLSTYESELADVVKACSISSLNMASHIADKG